MADTDDKPRGVDEQSDWIHADEHEHELACALREGVHAMRRHARNYKFMWPNPGEMEPVIIGGAISRTVDGGGFSQTLDPLTVNGVVQRLYDIRRERSDMPNPWAESIRSTARLPFRAKITYEGWDEELSGKTEKDATTGALIHRTPGWVDTLTPEGQSLDEYAAELFKDCLFEGVAYTLVDNDPRSFPDPASRRAAGAQPRATKFLRRDIRRITTETRYGVPRLLQVVLRQPIHRVDVTDPNAWFDCSTDARKVITAGDPDAPKGTDERKVRTQIFVREENEWVELPEERRFITPDNPVDELVDIPLVPHYSNRVSPYRGKCPFLDTAETQKVIWNVNSELLNLTREATIAFVHQSGVGIDPVTKKPLLPDTRGARFFMSTEPGSTLTIAEMQGTALKSVMGVVEWKIALIEKSHHQIQVERPTGPVTAREITLQGVQASSALEMWVIFQEQAWKRILDLFALLGGLPKRGVVSIPHDFGLPNTGMERLHALFIAGKMSPKGYWAEAQRAGDVDETFDVAAELTWDAGEKAAFAGPGGTDTASQAGLAALSKTDQFIEGT